MILTDGELNLRAIEPRDADALYDLINNPEIESLVVGWSGPVSLASQEDWIERLAPEDLRYALEIRSTICGTSHIHPIDFKNRSANINIKILPGFQGEGIGARSVRLMLDYLFNQLDIVVVTAGVLEGNVGSNRLFESVGFRLDGVLRSRIYKAGRRWDLMQYSILRDEYLAKH